MGHILVDFDGTLAVSIPGSEHLDNDPPPIPLMVNRVKKWLSEGRDVRIFTARAEWPVHHPVMEAVRRFCRTHFDKELPITLSKDGDSKEI